MKEKRCVLIIPGRLNLALGFLLMLFFLLPIENIHAQSDYINSDVEYVDSLFSILPLDANQSNNNLSRIIEDAPKFDSEIQAIIYANIGYFYRSSEMYDSARIYFNKGLKLAEDSKTDYVYTQCLINLARIHSVFAEYEESLNKLNLALNYTLNSDSAKIKSDIYRFYGNTYWGMEIYDFALENYFKSLEIAEEHLLYKNMSSAYNNIGLIYFSVNDYANAQKYFKLAINTARDHDHKWIIAVSSNNIGNILTEMGLYDSSLYYYRISRIESRKLGGRLHEGITVFNIGDSYLKLDSLELAREYLSEAYQISLSQDDKIGIAECFLKLGELEIKSNNLMEAKQYLDSALSTAIGLGSLSMQLEVYKVRIEYFKKIGESDSTVKSLEMLLTLKDTIAKIENVENIARLEYKFKEEVASQEIASLQKEKRITRILIFISASAFLIILIILSIFLGLSKKRVKELDRINNLLEEQRILLKEKNHELTISQDKLEKMVYGKDKFITIMSHDLKNPIGAVRGFLELMISNYDSISDEKKIKFLKEVFKSVENISLLIENILFWIRTQNTGVESSPEIINTSDKIAENISLYSSIAIWKKIKIKSEITEAHFIFADKNIFDTIIRNLLSNSLKFTSEGGEIILRSSQKDSFIFIELEDTGKGMTNDKIDEILNSNTTYSTEGTSKEKGTGLGLNLVNEFANILGAQLSISSQPGIGSKFTLKFPISEK